MATMKHVPRSWLMADVVYQQHAKRPRSGGKPRVNLGYATWLHQRAPEIEGGRCVYAIRLHQTDVVRFMPDRSIELCSGGWATVTTVDRLHQFTPAGVQVNGIGVYGRSKVSPYIEVTVGRGVNGIRFVLLDSETIRIAPELLA